MLMDERQSLRQKDDDLINEALGLKPKKKVYSEGLLEEADLKQLLSRGGTERSDLDIERIEGLGAAPAKVHEHIERLSYLEKEIKNLTDQKAGVTASAPVSPAVNIQIPHGTNESHRSDQSVESQDSSKHEKKKRKRHEKEEKKKKKKEKKKKHE